VARYIHLDISISGDSTSISMAGLKDWVNGEIQKDDGTFMKVPLPIVETDFLLRIRAKEGDRIPLSKTCRFILDLRAAGFNISLFTADLLLLSEHTLQILKQAGIPTGSLSLDKTNQPYLDFRNLLYDRRWVCHRHQGLLTELSNLEQSNEGKIDHPKVMEEIIVLSDGTVKKEMVEGTKDMSDATAGAVYNCLVNSNTPHNLETMREIFRKISETKPTPISQVDSLILSDSQGRQILGTKEDSASKIADIMRKMRR